MPLHHLQHKWVLVTGAASGIGLETAHAFANEGAHIILVDLNASGLDEARQAMLSKGVQCRSFVVDVAQEKDVAELARRVIAEVGAPRVLVNNAGIGFLGPMLHTPTSAWRRVFDVNVMGMVHMCQAFLPGMLAKAAPCHVVNVASAAGLMAAPNLSAYSASKHAVIGLHEALAMELTGSSIGLSLVCPGVINTPIVRNRKAIASIVPDAQMDKIDAYYCKHGASPALVGQRIVQAVRKGDELVLVGPTAKALDRIKRLSPMLARKATLMGCKVNGYGWRYPPQTPAT